ncbi:hypothetical protein [Paenibacillus taiwanensis]|uniref:hypothetical protein n=1 Tax=Paenibacillus taiwanensis TaxID=401638 RepID=UPI00048D6D5A|nr:hypothetical protein [Paenibacillus taiwanensis]
MNKNQRIVVEWLTNCNLNFMDNLVELEGSFDDSGTIPEEVREAYDGFTYVQKLEVVKKSASNLHKGDRYGLAKTYK